MSNVILPVVFNTKEATLIPSPTCIIENKALHVGSFAGFVLQVNSGI